MRPALPRIILVLVLAAFAISPLLGGETSQAAKPAPAPQTVSPTASSASAQPLACIDDRLTVSQLDTSNPLLPSLRRMPSGGCTFSVCVADCNDCPIPKHPYCANYTTCICGCR